jgi:hypothetical protein
MLILQKIRAYWNSLPPWAKGCIFIGASAASGAVKKYFDTPNACLSLHCLGQLALSALHVGGIAALGWVMDSPIGKTWLSQFPAPPKQ